ncbi:MAG: thiamine phosphate synthase [Burkholderiales bacterium]|nr:thiamine phosphate synthase [Burkholderiales bacterium]
MPMTLPRGLYAITPEEADAERLATLVRAAIDGGAVAVQYRNKTAPAALRRTHADALVALCRARGVPLIVNDDVELALAAGAEGVHLGAADGDLAAARARLGPGRLLGASCYDRLERALAAVAQGADHVAFGSVFPSATKPGAVRAPLALFTAARRALDCPLVAIGGITVENAGAVIAAGADAVAVISALFDAPDVAERARAFQRLFERQVT